MRRRLLLAVIAVASVFLLVAGCATLGLSASFVKDAELGNSGPIVLTEQDAGGAIEAVEGQELSVRLSSNRTTGFGWVVADPGPLRQRGESTYEAPQASPGVVGAGGNETFTFKADAVGSGTLKLEYRRPWEKDVPAEQEWDVTVTVK